MAAGRSSKLPKPLSAAVGTVGPQCLGGTEQGTCTGMLHQNTLFSTLFLLIMQISPLRATGLGRQYTGENVGGYQQKQDMEICLFCAGSSHILFLVTQLN